MAGGRAARRAAGGTRHPGLDFPPSAGAGARERFEAPDLPGAKARTKQRGKKSDMSVEGDRRRVEKTDVGGASARTTCAPCSTSRSRHYEALPAAKPDHCLRKVKARARPAN